MFLHNSVETEMLHKPQDGVDTNAEGLTPAHDS